MLILSILSNKVFDMVTALSVSLFFPLSSTAAASFPFLVHPPFLHQVLVIMAF